MSAEQISNYLSQYKEWLKEVKRFKNGTISSRISNIKVIGDNYDILKEYAIDECQGIMEELQSPKNGSEPKTAIVINGDYYTGLATYRQALKLFVEFLKDIQYVAPIADNASGARFVGTFNEFKRYVGPKCRNDVNTFCKSERERHKGICEYCGGKAVLQSAHIKERPVIIREILEQFYKSGSDYYDVNLDEFMKKFKEAHMPIPDHIFFLCKKCHDKLDKEKSITIADIKSKRSHA